MTDFDPTAVHLQSVAGRQAAYVAEHGTLVIDGDVLVGDGLLEHVVRATVARTDTAAKTLATLPAGAVITGHTLYGPAASDAGTTAVLDVGKDGGTGHEFLHSYDLTGASGLGQLKPVAAVLGSVGASPITVTGTYTETGTPSATGGPWTVIIRFTTS